VPRSEQPAGSDGHEPRAEAAGISFPELCERVAVSARERAIAAVSRA
jgi:hypothetical protein